MRIRSAILISIIAQLLIIFIVQELPAQPARNRILGDVDVSRDSQGVAINVRFTFPVRYVKHFPHEKGEELRIQLRPIAISQTDRDALSSRESVNLPPDNNADISQIVYEGDIEGGPFLTLFFNHPVAYTVSQGSDFRSIVIVIHVPEDSPAAPPNKETRDNT